MQVQQLIALALVAAAGLYLGRNLIQSARSFFSAKSGCGSGCSKCGFAPKDDIRVKPDTVRSSIIPLSEIRNSPAAHIE